jgi:hypothetical protein
MIALLSIAVEFSAWGAIGFALVDVVARINATA